nr:hypothetical protein [Alphaproteobacteria bacterium]
HSLRNEDDHVFNLVNKNTRLKKIFISLFKNDNGFYDEAIIEKVKNWRLEYPNRNYILYDAASAKVWNNGD